MKKSSSIANFEKALGRLREFLIKPVQDERDEAGVLLAFEFTYELAWKSLQKRADQEKLSVGSPRAALEYALKSGLITLEQEKHWLLILDDRNLTSHAYNAEIAHQVFLRVRDNHIKLFTDLLTRLIQE